jgi:hypothetical protein
MPSWCAERLAFAYIDYDPKDDVVVIGVGGRTSRYPVVLRHLVYQPSTVDIVEGDVTVPAVVDSSELVEIPRRRTPSRPGVSNSRAGLLPLAHVMRSGGWAVWNTQTG